MKSKILLLALWLLPAQAMANEINLECTAKPEGSVREEKLYITINGTKGTIDDQRKSSPAVDVVKLNNRYELIIRDTEIDRVFVEVHRQKLTMKLKMLTKGTGDIKTGVYGLCKLLGTRF